MLGIWRPSSLWWESPRSYLRRSAGQPQCAEIRNSQCEWKPESGDVRQRRRQKVFVPALNSDPSHGEQTSGHKQQWFLFHFKASSEAAAKRD